MSKPPSVAIAPHRAPGAVAALPPHRAPGAVAALPQWPPNLPPWAARQGQDWRRPARGLGRPRGKDAPVENSLGIIPHVLHEDHITAPTSRSVPTRSCDGAFPARVVLLGSRESSVSVCCAWETTVGPKVAIVGRRGGLQAVGADRRRRHRVIGATASWPPRIGRGAVAGDGLLGGRGRAAGDAALGMAPRWSCVGPSGWARGAAWLALGNPVVLAGSGRAGLAGGGGSTGRGA